MLDLAKTFFACIKRILPLQNRYDPINDTTSLLSTSDQADIIAVIEKAALREKTLSDFQGNVIKRYCRLWRLLNEPQR